LRSRWQTRRAGCCRAGLGGKFTWVRGDLGKLMAKKSTVES